MNLIPINHAPLHNQTTVSLSISSIDLQIIQKVDQFCSFSLQLIIC